MADWTTHANWTGPVIMIGFGSIGRGTLPLLLRHIQFDRTRMVIFDPSDANRAIADEAGIAFRKEAITRTSYRKLLKPLLTAGPERALIVNLSVDVGSLDIIRLARQTNALYIDTVIEPWPGFYYNRKANLAGRSNYVLREELLALKREMGSGPTAVACCGANPGMVSWLVKDALLKLAQDLKLKHAEPATRHEWASLMQKAGVRGIHVAERDTQVACSPATDETFLNTWSVDGFISEGLQPAELGWGTHEKKLPAIGKRHTFGSKAAIYLTRPGGDTRVRTWTPGGKAQFGLLVTHNEAISISDYYTLRSGRTLCYRPTCHYAYHPSSAALISMGDMFGRAGALPDKRHVLQADEILAGSDELGVLLYGHRRNALWYGSRLSIDTARSLAPHQNATGLQVSSAVMAGVVWAIENPEAGLVEADEMDFRRCLALQRPYLGELGGTYTDWTPVEGRDSLFAEKLDREDPWQFTNILVP